MSAEHVATVRRFLEAFKRVYTFRDRRVTRIQLFTDREPALAAPSLMPDHQEEKR